MVEDVNFGEMLSIFMILGVWSFAEIAVWAGNNPVTLNDHILNRNQPMPLSIGSEARSCGKTAHHLTFASTYLGYT